MYGKLEKTELNGHIYFKNQLAGSIARKVTVCHKLSKEENTVLSWKENHLKISGVSYAAGAIDYCDEKV